MRPRAALLVAVLAAGCGDSPSEPTGDLEAKLLFEPAPAGPFVEVPRQVFPAEDVIVARTTLAPLPGCHTIEAIAGRVRDVVLVTLTRRERSGFCEAFFSTVVARVEVRPIPRGVREVLFYERVVDIDGKTTSEQGPVQAELNPR